ncbi:hypothetical protein K470DRAFT_222457 [Piedraia hortae CBS 480.64]|uniref:GTP-binding protein n=1 Tax=Piedraia hortae CBS 480.64 TaxID=1314780 RepID=A0A6A7BSI4_9PEZI|nr:hypothetical protein K470DRAFT_222457 [Piedraia hortae CBS 480.64]
MQSRRRGHSPKVLIMGTKNSGKSSIRKIVLEKLLPADTLFLEPTLEMESSTLHSFITTEAIEIPSITASNTPPPSHTLPPVLCTAPINLSTIGSIIWLIDVQDELLPSITSMVQIAVYLAEYHPRVNLEVFIHKVDGLTDEYGWDLYREVRQRAQDELGDSGFDPANRLSIAFHQTSIYDRTVFEAMSRVVQKIIPQLPGMEALLNKLCSTCRIQKAYLLDTGSKLFVATDASPTFTRDYELCAHFVDVVADIKQLYDWREGVDGGDGDGDAHKEEDSTAIGESTLTYDPAGETFMYAREMAPALSLVCIMGKGCGPQQRVRVDYNVELIHEALLAIFYTR